MSKDELYRKDAAVRGSFEFNDSVAGVFPDMLERSIPGYRASIEAIESLAARYVQPDSRCFDLGCSLGEATLAMRRGISVDGCRLTAVDSASAMIERCRELTAASGPGAPPVDIVLADIRDVEITRASMVVMNYTLQFIPPDERQALIRRIADGMLDDGVFVLSEKVVDEDEVTEDMLIGLHHEFKRRNHYSELEISRKRSAIENVLIPETVAVHRDRLQSAGFRHVGVWLRYFNFVSIVAIR